MNPFTDLSWWGQDFWHITAGLLICVAIWKIGDRLFKG